MANMLYLPEIQTVKVRLSPGTQISPVLEWRLFFMNDGRIGVAVSAMILAALWKNIPTTGQRSHFALRTGCLARAILIIIWSKN
jgi:hypothetical protein